MQRTAIAVATSVMGVLMFYVCYAAGFVPLNVFLNAAGAAFLLMAMFVPLFYTGINLRCPDPSLFLPQTMSAVAVTSYVMAYAGAARPALVVLYFAALVLSAMRFNTRSFVALAIFATACHAAVIYAAMHIDGPGFNWQAEVMQWAFILITLPWLGWIASYLARLRQRFRTGDALYRAIWGTSIDAVVLIDQNGLIHLANPAAARLFGYDMENMRGMPVAALTPECLRARLAHDLDEYRLHGSVAQHWDRFEGIALTAEGREVPVEATLAELGSADVRDDTFGPGERRLVLFARDISQRHALETVKDDFIATVSHELRTPLTAVVGAVEALQQHEDVHLPAAAQSLLGMAAAGGARLQRLIDTILNLQKIETGGINFAPEPVAASALVVAAIAAARPAAAGQGKFLATTRLAEDITVRADARWMHEVLLNLIDNALKFSPPAATVVIGVEVSGSLARFSVIDQGAGVPPEFAGQVFKRFARADTSNTRAHGGAGLGLSVCKAAVEGCGGAIGYQNNPGKGATFWFELPLVQVTALPAITVPAAAAPVAPAPVTSMRGQAAA